MNELRAAAWAAAARPGHRIGHVVESHDTIGSTSDRARELLDRADGEGIVVVAEHQSAGRGRRGRTWTSPPGRNLTMSVGLRTRLPARAAWQLGLAAAVAARDACARLGPVALKWPNDLVVADGAKVGGVLVETAVEGERIASAVVGIGINVNWPRDEMPIEIRESATSLADAAGRVVDRVALLGGLLGALEGHLDAIEGGRSPLDAYRSACQTLGEWVDVETPSGRIAGRAVDLDPVGALVVETADGRVVVTSGEVVRVRRAVPA